MKRNRDSNTRVQTKLGDTRARAFGALCFPKIFPNHTLSSLQNFSFYFPPQKTKSMSSELERRSAARLRILELANMISVPMCLHAAVRLGVPNALWNAAPLSAAQILTRVGIPGDAENLQRILRMLASHGVFSEAVEDGERKYSLTEVGMTLVADADGLSYSSYVLQHHQVRPPLDLHTTYFR